MKLEIDFDNKTIEVKDGVTLGELVAKMKELRIDWKTFRILQTSGWTYYPTVPSYPPTTLPWAEITYGTSIN